NKPYIDGISEMISKSHGYGFTNDEQKKYQGSLWNTYKNIFKNERLSQDSPLNKSTHATLAAFSSNRVTESALGAMKTGLELVHKFCSAHNADIQVLNFANTNLSSVKEGFIQSFNKERKLDGNQHTNKLIADIKLEDPDIKVLGNAISKIITIVKGGN